MKISVIGTGYVGLVSGVCLADVGHQVTCIDIDSAKVNQLKKGKSPIYEQGLDDLIRKNISEGRLSFTTDLKDGVISSEIIIIAVGTPSNFDGTVNLGYIEQAAAQIGKKIERDTVVVTKSTVPIGTNERIKEIINENLKLSISVEVVSCPEFLREGSAVHDTFNGERIIIGAESQQAAHIVERAFKPFNIPIIHTDIRSAEMIKYASNAFLAAKISFMNEIANLCERVGANVEEVALGMGKDSRIGDKFLNAGIGYGGSCFPKDTSGLYTQAKQSGYEFKILNSVMEVNEKQQLVLVDKLLNVFNSLEGKTISILGLSFKPNTDDIREAASIKIINQLLQHNCIIKAYDPIASENVAKLFKNSNIQFSPSYQDALSNADCMLLLTEWQEFKEMDLSVVKKLLNSPVIFDGRNCFDLEVMEREGFTYVSIGRPEININNFVNEVHTNDVY